MSGKERMWAPLFALGATLLLATALIGPRPGGTWAAPPAQSVEEGQTLFQQKCTACHTVGGGDLVGPDLKGVTSRRVRDWLSRWLSAPDRLLAEKDPIATELLQKYNNVPMPNLGLSASEVAALIAYLEAQAGGVSPTPTPPATTLGGDPAVGKGLFMGTARFQNGGPPCMACHSVAGIGALGGGALGPDLTQALTRYGGAAGLTAFLTGVPTATMNSVWTRSPMTPEERANVVAFLEQASVSQRPAGAVGQLAGLAAAGTVVVLGTAQLVWRRRLRAVRRPMVSGRAPKS